MYAKIAGLSAFSVLIGLSMTSVGFGQTKAGPTPSPKGAAVYFIDLKNGATIAEKSTVHFGLHGMGVAPAGSEKANSGHHHLLIDTDLPPLDESIPADPNHLHFGAGQTEADVTLTPGDHTLQLLLGDKDHIPHNPPVMSERILVHVKAGGQPADRRGRYSPYFAPKCEGLFRISHRWQLRDPDADHKVWADRHGCRAGGL